jgi:hypothetical protein
LMRSQNSEYLSFCCDTPLPLSDLSRNLFTARKSVRFPVRVDGRAHFSKRWIIVVVVVAKDGQPVRPTMLAANERPADIVRTGTDEFMHQV